MVDPPSSRLSTPPMVWAAAALSLLLGLTFVFIRSPLPWGWEGFDFYHERSLTLAREGTFNTTDVPFGYVAFLAAHYRLFGDEPWIPLTVQVLLNATMPLMTYRLARIWLDERTSMVAAVLVGTFSFNTLYAATQSSDAVCNVMFLAGILLFANGWLQRDLRRVAGAALLLGLAPHFRPNLLLFPFALAGVVVVWGRRLRIPAGYAAVLVVGLITVTVPAVVRNYRVTGLVVPTSTHGAVQLWYGTLEQGPYLNARTRNPRMVFETSPLPYTSIADKSIIVAADSGSCRDDRTPNLEYWTDRDTARQSLRPRAEGQHLQYEIPGQPDETTVYYRFVSARHGNPVTVSIAGDPLFVYFVNDDHTSDFDRHGDVLDVFDVARLVQHLARGVPGAFDERLDRDGDRRLSEADLRATIHAMLWELPGWSGHWLPAPDDALVRVETKDGAGVLTFKDGSQLTVPRDFRRVTDLIVSRGLANQLAFATRPMSMVASGTPPTVPECRAVLNLVVNEVFYRRDVDSMRRHQALAIENIRQNPGAFLMAALYRAVRVFVILGSSDAIEARTFSRSALIYLAGTIASVSALVLFLVGIVITMRRRQFLWLLLLPPLYVSATIAPFFTNMRYTLTVQPFIFTLIAVTLVAAWDRIRPAPAPESAPVSS